MLNLKTNPLLKYLTFFISINSFVSVVLNLFLLLSLESDNATVVIGVGVMVLLAAITLVVSVYVVKSANYSKAQFVFVLLISLAQSFIIFTDGFYFKYTQALEWVGFYCINDSIEGTGFRLAHPVLNANFILRRFSEASGSLIGVNIIFLIISIYMLVCLIKRKS